MTFEWLFGPKGLFLPPPSFGGKHEFFRMGSLSCFFSFLDAGESRMDFEQAKNEFRGLRNDCTERDWCSGGRSFVVSQPGDPR